jgi:YqaJ-like viral recombinase domain
VNSMVGAVAKAPEGVVYHRSLEQGTDEWLMARCGLLTASEMKLIVTPTLKIASNDKERTHLYELAAQRIASYVEPHFQGFAMERGQKEEFYARDTYRKHIAPVEECGFITNDRWGFKLGYSPDGLVRDDGQIEVKSRAQKYQIQTIIEHIGDDRGETIPSEFTLQIQTGMLVSERAWCDFISYSNGLHMAVIRVHADPVVQNAILEAAAKFEARMAERISRYFEALETYPRLIPTERRQTEMHL